MQSQLEPAVDLLRKMVMGANIKTQQFQYNPDTGSLTIVAEPVVLERIADILQDAGSAYFSDKNKQIKTMLFSDRVEKLPQDLRESTVTCAMQ